MSRTLAALALVALVLSSSACSERPGGAQAKPGPPPPVPVGAGTAQKKVVPVQVIAVGNVQAFTTVGVKSQVAGQVQTVHFTEGQDVQEGQLLFTIDPRPLEATLRQAEANVAKDTAQLRQMEAALGQRQAEVTQALANLERDRAQLRMAATQEERYRRLQDEGLIAREQYDQVRTAWAALTASVQADQAAVENARASTRAAEAMLDNGRAAIKASEGLRDTARLQLAYTTIKAPIHGRTGNISVQAGNVVKGNDDGPLVVIAQVRPIYVSFTVPEQQLSAIQKFRAEGSLKVAVQLDGGRRTVTGPVTFINNSVDPTTGTIQLKATFPNADNVLWPGQFVDVAMTLTTENAVVVPSSAVQTGQQGAFVFIVKPDNTVESRPVKVGRRMGRELVIEQGVKHDERVVTDGQLRLFPGARVDVRPAKPS